MGEFFRVLGTTLRIPKASFNAAVFVILNLASYLLPKLIDRFETLQAVTMVSSLASLFFLFQFIRYFYTVRVKFYEQKEEEEKAEKRKRRRH